LVCGDIQTPRHKRDLDSMSVPLKYRKMGSFPDYFYGRKHIPVPTVVIGGNHEASAYLSELFYGGFLCPNMYYLGSAGVINVSGIRIAGISGIYDPRHYNWGKTFAFDPGFSQMKDILRKNLLMMKRSDQCIIFDNLI